MACTFSPNLYLKAQDGHNCDASLWINEQGHISAEPLEMFLWEIRVQVMQNQVAIAMGNRVGTEGDVAFAGQSVVVDPYVNAASEADDQEQLIIADIDLTQTAAARKQRPFLGLRRPEWYVVVPEFLRTLVFARPRGDDQFADCTFSPSLDMSR
ncbi:nitrilase-related carbon-nitrogen hydrolase [Bifidobacterium longum]|nr:nitrilase-related carbon-nitrogen hydrolase [Bifidobacterium longum]MCZ4462816.1 carbon-nitrogen hydrolase family protein [Bifidobacterium longum subsp. longum]MCZ4464651.1 carbon-nitrogen hydrolase family protein [Bifidobacterium longum subsp. longum]